jgi:rhamnogalacturonyl hydrolase YesR
MNDSNRDGQGAGDTHPLVDQDLSEKIHALLVYCQQDDWAGYDPYDGLNSRLFQATPLRRSAFARLALTQFMKRCPVNFRGLIRVPKTINAKGIALFTSSAIKLEKLGLVEAGTGKSLADKLIEIRSPGYETMCWGYPFDWQNRHFLLPKYDPNIICSTFGGNALLDAYDHYGEQRFLDAAVGVARFVREELNRTEDGDTFCFSYTPHENGQVHNANLLGGAYLSRVWQHTKEDALRDEAIASSKYSINRQREDGSWVYGESPKQGWVDSFHTGYNLLAIRQMNEAFDLGWMSESLERGFQYYYRNFFEPGGVVKYYDNSRYPIDIHAVAHAIVTLSELSDMDPNAIATAKEVYVWANAKMRSRRGFYFFQKKPLFTNRIPYIRWSQAWMLLALSSLAEAMVTKDQDVI